MNLTKVLNEQRELLLEASYKEMLKMQRYYNILDSIEIDEVGSESKSILNTAIKEHLNKFNKSVKRLLNRDDRIVWYIRFMRLQIFEVTMHLVKSKLKYNENEGVHEANDKTKKLIKKELEFFNKGIDGFMVKFGSRLTAEVAGEIKQQIDDFSRRAEVDLLERPLEHFLSLDVNGIQTFRFEKQSPTLLFREMRKIEQEWKEKRKRFIPNDLGNEDVLISFGSDWKWVDLLTASCDAEADAMGHCGNSPHRGSANQTIFSLRERKMLGKEVWWQPHATFIYHKKEKGLGEMKGFGNDKPSDKHHKYIVPLLMHKKVQQILGGSWEPQYNFALSDLSDTEQKMIAKKKPQLLSLLTKVNIFGKEFLVDEFKNDPHSEVIGDSLVMRTYDDVVELIDELGDDKMQHYLPYITGDSFFELYDSPTPSKSDLESNMTSKNLKKVTDNWAKNDPEEEYIDWWDYFEAENDSVADSIKSAWRDAEESGASSEMHEYFIDSIKDGIDGNGSDDDLYDIVSGDGHILDSKHYLVMSFESMEVFINNDIHENYRSGEVNALEDLTNAIDGHIDDVDPTIALDEPHYGFSGFDEEYFNEMLFNDAEFV